MKKSDVLTLLGIVSGFGMIIWGMLGEAGLSIFWDTQSLAITLGGSFCALLITYSISDIKNIGKLIIQSMKEVAVSEIELIDSFAVISTKARKEGLLSLEEEINEISDSYMKKGLQMVVDGVDGEIIEEILQLEIEQMEARHNRGINLLKAWAEYAPAFGMVGTLLGLIKMLANLGGDAESIASGMSISLITTFYGSVLANLIFLPFANNLTAKSKKEVAIREMMLEGILAIQSGVNPRVVEEKLSTYLGPQDKLVYLNKKLNSSEGDNK
ncbi:motility protein A [Clostridium mediterraneense]|uniref:motility protein A n=1 Tax=Clostridium mediterraneense TaxID=1805472 RepID=UPI00082F2B43|nr:motility protein A [Clostridium mediterraneense]